MGFADTMRRRWAERPDRTLRLQEAVKLPHTPAEVWALIVPAEYALVLSPRTVRAFTVPGTPAGVGQQQCFVDLDGNTTIIEVTEYLEARHATVQQVSPRPSVPFRSTYDLHPLEAGCILTVGLEGEAPSGSYWPRSLERDWRRQQQDYLDRVRRALAAETT